MAARIIAILLAMGISVALGQANGFCNLVWSDEFSGSQLSSDWEKEQTCYGGGNNEMQCYTARDKNIFLDNGNLVLKAIRETYTGSWTGCTDNQGCDWTKSYTSGKINTRFSRWWKYGRYETRAKLPSGTQLWPAIWMMPKYYRYGGWAASGEIDIMESRGNNPWMQSGTLHHGGQWPNNRWTTNGDFGIGQDLSKDFHTYTLEWTPDYMKWYIDNTLTQQFNMNRWWNTSSNGVYNQMGQPFDQEFHFILNLAVGGMFFGGDAPVTDAQSAAWASPEMRVDYVRVWQQGGDCSRVPTQGADVNNRPVSQAPQNTGNGNNGGTRPTGNTQTTGNQPNGNVQVTGNVQPTGNNVPATSRSQQPSTNGKCNGQGYDQASYTCTMNELGKERLCPRTQSACGDACYDSNSLCCLNGGLVPKAQCPRVTVPTSAASSRPTPSSTAASSRPTPSSTVPNTPTQCATPFGQQGYDPSRYTCTINDRGQNILCAKNMASCGSACFNPSMYCCRGGDLRHISRC